MTEAAQLYTVLGQAGKGETRAVQFDSDTTIVESISSVLEPLSQNLQEARSIRYTVGVRVAMLSSGAWAVFWGGEQGFDNIEIMDGLDAERLMELVILEREQRERAGSTVVRKRLEEMGL